MTDEEMSWQFCEGLFQTEDERTIVRRILEGAEEIEIIEELLTREAAKGGE